MKIKIEIELGNDLMKTKGDVLSALTFAFARTPPVFQEGHSGRIMDDNGNTVGSWEVKSATD